MEILLYLDRCESTTTFPKSMLSLRNRLTPSLSRGTIFFPLSPHFSTGPQKQDIGLVPAVHQFIIGERTHRARSLTNQIKNNLLFRILSPAISIAIRGPYAVDQIISQIYIYIYPSTQVIEMILDDPNQSTKAKIFHEIDSCSNSNSV